MAKFNSNRNKPESPTLTNSPQPKFKKTGSFQLGFDQDLLSPQVNNLMLSRTIQPRKDSEDESAFLPNQEFNFSTVGGFFIASEVIYSQNRQERVSYLTEDTEVQSSLEMFENFVTMKACKLLISDVLKSVISSLVFEAIHNIKNTLKNRASNRKSKTEGK